MFSNPSLVTRIAVGKLVGLIFGLAGFIFLPLFWPEADLMIRWGILLWYITLGAIVGIMGVITWNPVFRHPVPWWFRASLIGGWMNFVLTFFAYDVMKSMLASTFGADGLMTSPYWFVAEGAFIGLVIGYFATRFGGEGKEAVDADALRAS